MSCTDTCLAVYVDESAAFYSETKPRAAKPHQCCECWRTIEKGETYERVNGKWDGTLATFTTCAECAEIRKAFCCQSWMLATLWDDIRDQLFPRWRCDDVCIIDCLAKLTTVAATEKILAKYAEYVEDQS